MSNMRTEQAGHAVIYARVSSKQQEEEGFSIPAQLKLLREYATAKGFSVLEEFVDVETAKRAGRTGFDEMVEFLLKRHNPCRIVLVEKTDRLYRNLRDYVTLDELDLEIHFVKENFVLSDDSRSTEKFMHGIKVLMAKNYIDNLSEETSKGMREKAEQGIWPSYAPLGYLNMDTNGKRHIVLDPESAPLIRRLFELYATGDYSLLEVTRQINEEGLCHQRSGRPVVKSAIHKILHNSMYYGDFIWNGNHYQGTHEPIVSKELWDKVQQSRMPGATAGLDTRSTGGPSRGLCRVRTVAAPSSPRRKRPSTSTTTARGTGVSATSPGSVKRNSRSSLERH